MYEISIKLSVRCYVPFSQWITLMVNEKNYRVKKALVYYNACFQDHASVFVRVLLINHVESIASQDFSVEYNNSCSFQFSLVREFALLSTTSISQNTFIPSINWVIVTNEILVINVL